MNSDCTLLVKIPSIIFASLLKDDQKQSDAEIRTTICMWLLVPLDFSETWCKNSVWHRNRLISLFMNETFSLFPRQPFLPSVGIERGSRLSRSRLLGRSARLASPARQWSLSLAASKNATQGGGWQKDTNRALEVGINGGTRARRLIWCRQRRSESASSVCAHACLQNLLLPKTHPHQ